MGKTIVHINLKHYEGLHKIDKEQERKNPSGFAAKDSIHNPAPLVEERSLASYVALEEGDSV
ncbi:hypothetical protein ACQKL6_18250 [Peribacillus sp. NPDC097197]|uniref:hypothetical protein n=1 Tax=Peribacillus sp. NPDC097197 TaxID=3390615 RepID=UPI003D083C1C